MPLNRTKQLFFAEIRALGNISSSLNVALTTLLTTIFHSSSYPSCARLAFSVNITPLKSRFSNIGEQNRQGENSLHPHEIYDLLGTIVSNTS